MPLLSKTRVNNTYFLDKIYIFDKYYNRFFLKNLIIFVSLFIIVYFFSLFLSALPELLKKSSYNDFITFKNIISYYLYLFPTYINDTIAFSYLFTMSYTLGVFYAQHEILAFVAAGVKTIRISLISILIALLISILLMIANCTIFPKLLSKAEVYNQKLNLSKNERYINNIQIRDADHLLYFGQYYLEDQQTLQDFLILKENLKCNDFKIKKNLSFPNLNNMSVNETITSLFKEQADTPQCFPFSWYLRGKNLVYNKKNKSWRAEKYIFGEFLQDQNKLETLEQGELKELNELKISPDFFKQEDKKITILTFSQALYKLNQLKIHLEPSYEFTVDMIDNKFLKPLQLFFLALFASTLGKFFSRRNIFIFSLIYSFIIAFTFLVLINIGYSLAKTKTLSIFMGISFGYILGFIILLVLYKRQMS